MLRVLQQGIRRARHFNQTLKSQGVSPLARIVLVLQKVKQRLLPFGSRRLRLYRVTFGRVSGPVLRWAYRQLGQATSMHPDLASDAPLVFEEIDELAFPETEEPLVSILIPVFEQWQITYECLGSILRYSGERVAYEVLVLDDCSKDEITRLHEKTPGVRYIRNQTNLRFLHNCNHGAEFARGKYLLLLNNDTLVHEGWLEAMVERAESDSKIGLVAAKLIGKDGLLQEAGGIIFQDASGWNYGRGQDPNHPSFNFFKDTDYGSGACILVPTKLWRQVGGFDARFAPAYYEDTDLAFAIRALGFRTVYEPRAVVTHLEGVSHGTDVASGLKRYQVENQKKFFEKWKKVLLKEHAVGPELLDRAHARSLHRPRVFFADYQIPQWDGEAGGRLVWMYMQLMLDLGFQIVFRPANLFPTQPYTSILQSKGIEVLHGGDFLDIDAWLKEHGKNFDFAYLHRPEVAQPLLDPLRKHTKARIVYQCCDLHHLRYQREWETAGKKGICPESQRQKELEYGVIEEVDVVHTPSTYECELLRRDFPHKKEKIKSVPIFIYDELPDYKISVTGRNLLFVGGYGHPPNEDAILWFAEEIFPLVLKECPQAVLHLVGGGAGPAIQKLVCQAVQLHGRVDDDALEVAYQQADVTVVPLRYGAGVKGKVVEAMAQGVPVVTTSIGAEGIPKSQNPLVVGDTAEEFAARVCALLQDVSARRNLAEQGQSFVRIHYGRQVAEKVLATDFPHPSLSYNEEASC